MKTNNAEVKALRKQLKDAKSSWEHAQMEIAHAEHMEYLAEKEFNDAVNKLRHLGVKVITKLEE